MLNNCGLFPKYLRQNNCVTSHKTVGFRQRQSQIVATVQNVLGIHVLIHETELHLVNTVSLKKGGGKGL